LDNHANQLNPNNPRYAGHQERLAATEAAREAAVLHQQAQAAYQYANEMETGIVLFLFISNNFLNDYIIISCYASKSSC
jgi:type I site-specific restriction endonuclease